jgi:hypothetical protein
MHSAKVTVATTATLIVSADDKPRTVYIHNAGGAKIYVGGSSKASARRAQAYAERVVAKLDETK